MELRQLRYLVVLAEERHFTRAAARLGIAQPALSQQIRRLETQLGLTLVERTTRRVAVTAAGTELVEHARRVLLEVERATDAMGARRGLEAGRVVLGVTRTPGGVDVVGALARFNRAHTGIELDVREALSVELVASLEDDTLDLALVTLPEGPAHPLIAVEELAVEDLVLVVAPDHRLARRRAVAMADLAGEPLVAFHRGATIRELLDERSAAEGVPLRVAFETADVVRARALVSHGLGVAVLPRSDARLPGDPVVVLPFRGRALEHRTGVAVRRGRHIAPAAAAFAEVLREGAG